MLRRWSNDIDHSISCSTLRERTKNFITNDIGSYLFGAESGMWSFVKIPDIGQDRPSTLVYSLTQKGTD